MWTVETSGFHLIKWTVQARPLHLSGTEQNRAGGRPPEYRQCGTKPFRFLSVHTYSANWTYSAHRFCAFSAQFNSVHTYPVHWTIQCTHRFCAFSAQFDSVRAAKQLQCASGPVQTEYEFATLSCHSYPNLLLYPLPPLRCVSLVQSCDFCLHYSSTTAPY